MINFSYEGFWKDIKSLKRKLKSRLNGLYQQAEDQNFATSERHNVFSSGWETYVYANPGHLVESFDKGYKLGHELYDLLGIITKQAVEQSKVPPAENERDEDEYLKEFRKTFPSIKIIKRRAYLYQRLEEDDSLETTYWYMVERYALDQLRDELSKTLDKKNAKTVLKKIGWQGTQQQLGDLCMTLTDQGWFSELPEPDTLKAVFPNSDSIEQLLRPTRYSEDGKPLYEKIRSKRYRSPFFRIEKFEKKVAAGS